MKKLRLAAGIIILLAPIFIISIAYKSDKFIIYLLLSLPLIIKGACEVIRYYTHKGINSLDNYVLSNAHDLHKPMLWICIIFVVIIPTFVWIYITNPDQITNNIGKPQPVLFITMASVFIFSVLSIVDYFILRSKRFAKKEAIEQSGKAGETKVLNVVKSFCEENHSYQYFNNILLKYQEFDCILVGENGIFNIEVKNYNGENTIISIDSNGNWTKEKFGKKSTIENPIQQVNRHHEVLQNIFQSEFPIIDILVIANSDNIIKGCKNTPLNLVKLDALPTYVTNYKPHKKLSNGEILHILETIEEFKQSSRHSNY